MKHGRRLIWHPEVPRSIRSETFPASGSRKGRATGLTRPSVDAPTVLAPAVLARLVKSPEAPSKAPDPRPPLLPDPTVPLPGSPKHVRPRERKSALAESAKHPNATASAKQTTNVLDAVLPPREVDDSSALWVQRVTSAPATRLDVVALRERLDASLRERRARETGVCPVREELYAQCFDELIRQVTVTCAERGLLLLRVRDELRMSIAAYQTLYESGVAFGMRKALQAERGKSEMAETVDAQAKKIADLERREAEWRTKCEAIEAREAERRSREETKHAEETAFLNRANKQLKQQLDKFLQEPPSAAKK